LSGSYILKPSGVQHATSLSAIQSERAYYAARAEVEWGYGNCATGSTLPINNFSVTATCSDQGVSYKEGDLNSIKSGLKSALRFINVE